MTILEAFVQTMLPSYWENERSKLMVITDHKFDMDIAVFILTQREKYNTTVIDSVFTPVYKLAEYYEQYVHHDRIEFGQKCLKLIARIEKWKFISSKEQS